MAETFRLHWVMRVMALMPLLLLGPACVISLAVATDSFLAVCHLGEDVDPHPLYGPPAPRMEETPLLHYHDVSARRAHRDLRDFGAVFLVSSALLVGWVLLPGRCIWSVHLRLTEEGLERVYPWPFGPRRIASFPDVKRFGVARTSARAVGLVGALVVMLIDAVAYPKGRICVQFLDEFGVRTKASLFRYQRQEELLAKLAERIPAPMESLKTDWLRGLVFQHDQPPSREAA